MRLHETERHVITKSIFFAKEKCLQQPEFYCGTIFAVAPWARALSKDNYMRGYIKFLSVPIWINDIIDEKNRF